jgi:hypothetical protein
MPRSAGPIAEAAHLSKLRDANGAIACLHRGLTHIAQTGVRNGIWIVQSWLMGIKLAAGRTAEVIADGLPLLEQMRGTRNETALAICRRVVLTALLAHNDLDRARPLAHVGWRQAARFAVLAHAAWPDLLALQAALERRPRAAAKLLSVGDASWARIGRQRGPTTRGVVQRAESIVSDALGNETFAYLRREGALLRSEDVDAIAFAVEDIS